MTPKTETAQATRETFVLGIETSCDETAAAVVLRDDQGRGRILGNVVRSQWEQHRAFGGVVPEIAARAHVDCLDQVIAAAMAEAGLPFSRLDAVATTTGPGLVGGLVVGAVTGKAIALAQDCPFIAVNHLEAHALTVGLTEGLLPPYLLLLVSGGHTQLLIVHGVGHYTRLGATIDDALGEAFDKTAKLLGLEFPGGPAVERQAEEGNPTRFLLPRPLLGRDDMHFSFSGLKTAVRRRALALNPLGARDIADLCASFQAAAIESVADRCQRAMAWAVPALDRHGPRRFVIAGGVAANREMRRGLEAVALKMGYTLHAPPLALCGDNGAMIAWTGAERLAMGLVDPLDALVRPRWPLDAAAPPVIGAGVKA